MRLLPNRITEQDIQAYVDGRLEEARVRVVEEYLNRQPEEAQRVRQLLEINRQLRVRHQRVLSEPASISLPAVRGSTAGWPKARAAAVAWLVFGTTVGWFMHGESTVVVQAPMPLVKQAAFAHVVYTPEVVHPVEVGAGQEAHLVTWLSRRMNSDLHVPDLTAQGYHLVGGRLLPDDGRPAAQFMYESATGQRITLYVNSSTGNESETSFRYSLEGTVSVFYWIDRSLGYALSGELDKEELLALSTAVYRQLLP